MKLAQLGEFGLIDLLAREIGQPRSRSVVKGVGDDCAVLEISNFPARPAGGQFPISKQISKSKSQSPKYLLLTTDTLIENVHFNLKKTSFFDLGLKALAVNISDIAAMGGEPTCALVTLGANKNTAVEKIEELYRGIRSLAKKHRIEIVGGDTVQSPKELIVSITLLGEVERENLLLRSTAKVGDAILVTGVFGGPAAAKYDSRKLKAVPAGRQVESRTQEARKIARSHLATAMIDSSDGLVRSVIEICRASKVGARIQPGSVPIAKGATLDQALYGGEEYELVFTAPRAKAQKLARLVGGVSVVGEIVSKKQGVKLIDARGKVFSLKSGGYEHFK